jgi:hypothetical protein
VSCDFFALSAWSVFLAAAFFRGSGTALGQPPGTMLLVDGVCACRIEGCLHQSPRHRYPVRQIVVDLVLQDVDDDRVFDTTFFIIAHS